MKTKRTQLIDAIVNSKQYRSLALNEKDKDTYIVEEKSRKYVFSKELFNLNKLGISVMKNAYNIEVVSHTHEFFEVQYVYSGTVIQVINGERVELPKGSITVFNKQANHSIPKGTEMDRMYHIGIDERMFDDIFFGSLIPGSEIGQYIEESLNGKAGAAYVSFRCEDPALLDLLNLMNREYLARNHAFEKNMSMYLALFFNKIHQSTLEDGLGIEMTAVQQRIRKIEEIIADEYKDITLQGLAKIIHVHPNYLSKFIRKQMGCKFSDLLSEERMNRARYFLLATDASIEYISAEVGYQNVNYFYKIFKNRYGMTPREFRTDNRKTL